MYHEYLSQLPDTDPEETAEWKESLDAVVDDDGRARVKSVGSIDDAIYRFLVRHPPLQNG